MDSNSLNYDSDAVVDSGCVPLVTGCMVPEAVNFDSSATRSTGCRYPIGGCRHAPALNFAADATYSNHGRALRPRFRA